MAQQLKADCEEAKEIAEDAKVAFGMLRPIMYVALVLSTTRALRVSVYANVQGG